MTDRFRLTPKDDTDPSWQYSKTRKSVFIFAEDEPEARRRVAKTLYDHNAPQPPPATRHQKITSAASPWELDHVTSCDVDKSNTNGYPNHVWADDGEKWPTEY